MKKVLYVCIAAVALSLTACGGKKSTQADDNMAMMLDTTDVHGYQRMQESRTEQKVEFKGKDYTSLVNRTPDESLSRVKSQGGDIFVDNAIAVKLTRGVETIFARTFTKNDFASQLTGEFLQNSILEGIVFNKTTPQGIMYTASVCYPQTDMFILFAITVSQDGRMTIEKDEQVEEIHETDSI